MDRVRRLREVGFVRGRYQSKFRARCEPKTRRTKRVVRGQPWESLFMRKSRAEKRAIVAQPWEFPMAAQHLAAVLLQKRARGMLARLRIVRTAASSSVPTPSSASASVPMSPMQRFVASGGRFEDMRGFRAFTAARLQAWVRGRRQRWAYSLQRFPVYHIAALQIQYAWKAREQRLALAGSHPQLQPRTRAALRVQAAWRRYTNRRIFRYYRDLVAFQDAGAPAAMLRAVNPGEAALLDAAMGAVVRFRLGGLNFPPAVYYKVFTRRPVCDVNAFSPKDYARDRRGLQRGGPQSGGPQRWGPQSADPHGTADPHQCADRAMLVRVGGAFFRARRAAGDRSDARAWYQRLEHNGWRPVTAKVLADAAQDPIARATGRKPASSRLQPARGSAATAGALEAREAREAARRRHKREWMRKLYAQGLLSAKAAAARPNQRAGDEDEDESGDESGDAPEIDFAGETWEDEADELFHWAAALDYDAYVGAWHALGRTASSDRD